MRRISVVNFSRTPDLDVQRALRALNRQIADDFGPAWGLSATLRLEGAVNRRPTTSSVRELRGEGSTRHAPALGAPSRSDVLTEHIRSPRCGCPGLSVATSALPRVHHNVLAIYALDQFTHGRRAEETDRDEPTSE